MIDFGPWLLAGTPVEEPYPCRCSERRFKECSPMWCPCAGRPDILPEPCCSGRHGPAEVQAAQMEYRIRKNRERAAELAQSDP